MLDTKDFSLRSWLKEDKATFFGTAICPIISLIATGFSFSIKSVKQFFGLSIDSCISWLYFLQAIFVAVSFVFIWQHRDSILRKLTQREGLLRNYLQKECHLRNEEEFTMDDRFAVIKETVEKFYQWWMVIWVVWFIYYGMLFLNSLFTFQEACAFLNTHALFWVRCGVDFVTSCLLFLIYLTLNNVTVAKRFRQDYHSFDFKIGSVFLFIAIIIIGTFLIYCASMAEVSHMFAPMLIVSLTLGIFSTFTFVLMLGKLNSFYLQIPIILNIMVYLYAIVQIFTPLGLLANGWENLRDGFVITTMPFEVHGKELDYKIFNVVVSSPCIDQAIQTYLDKIHIIFLCITLIGKMCLAYVIYWTVYKSRFIYFVVTKSMALTETSEKLMVFWKYIGKSEN